jgi:tRNA (adenine57-N1/adenine58-N1)-methyltransferase
VGEEGRVYGFDVRGDHLRVARTNLERAGLAGRVTLAEGDIADALGEDRLDAIVLDVPDPGRVVAAVAPRLAVGGTIACYTPLVSQMEGARQALETLEFGDVRSIELIERRWLNRGRGSRPDIDMLGHTGFLTFGRRVRA